MIWLLAAAALAAGAASPSTSLRSPASVGGLAGGEFVDRAGTRHPWSINRAHALVWDGKAYLPAGVVLHVPAAASTTPAGTDASQNDGAAAAPSAVTPVAPAVVSALDLLVAHGIKDVCLVRQGGWLAGDAAADQALVDGLESRGLRYGIALDARPIRPLAGYLAAPSRIEVPADWRQPGRRLKWDVDLPGARAALYALVDVESASVIAAGSVPVSNGAARIEVSFRPARHMFAPGPARLLVVPERALDGPPEESPVDFWSAWEDVEQVLTQRLTAVKWGPGLRFFARPAAASFGLRGEGEELIPASGGFRLEFESWLERRYSVNDLNSQWALNDRQVNALAVAARLVPLWGREDRSEKSGWLLDPVTNEWYRADLHRCAFWRDFGQFRADSIRRAISGTATRLKKLAADVPVVWEWTEYHPLFTNPQEVGGLDGLAFVAQGWGREAAVGTAAYAYAQVESSARPTWFLEIGQRSGNAAPPASAAELRLDWNWLREIGCKAVYADGVATSPATGTSTAFWAAPPERLDWIKAYAEEIAGSDTMASSRPAALYFPSGAVGTSLTGQMENGVWWLPSFASGQRLTLGEELQGYWIAHSPDPAPADAAGGVLVLWSTAGPQKATFVVPADIPVTVYDLLGHPLKHTTKRGRLQVPLDATPVLVTGLPLQNVFPTETASEALSEFEGLVKAAEAQKMDVSAFRLALSQARTLFTPASASTTYEMLRAPLAMLRAALTPYIWIEGEAAVRSNWSGVQPDPRASGGAYLHLDRSAPPANGAYQASYAFNIEREAEYEVWLAGSIPGGANTSGFTWRMDDRTPELVVAVESAHRYAGDLGWTRLGQLRIAPGRHTLVISATEPARSGGYHLDLDTLVLSREPFQPNGIRRPEFRVARETGSQGSAVH